MCRQSLIAARWSARPSTTTWCVNGGPAPTWTTCSTWLEPTNQQRGSWSVSTAWPLCPSSAGWREIQTFTQSGVPDCSGDRSFSTEDRVVGEGEPRQRALALRIDLPPCCKRWSEPPGKKKKSLQFWHLVEFHQGKGLIHVWLNLVFSSVDWDFLLQQEPTAFRAAEIMERLASVAAWQKNRNQGHQHFGVQ